MADERPEVNELGRDQILERAFDRNGGFLYVALTNSGGSRSIIDDTSNALASIDFWNHKLHQGGFFQSDAIDLSMAVNDTLVLAFRTPAGEEHIHLVTDFVTNGDAHLDVIEGADWDSLTGTLSPIRNRLSLSTEVSDLLEDQAQTEFVADGNIILNPTNLVVGTILDTKYTFTETPRGEGGGMGDREWILKTDTQYAIRVTSDVNNNKAQLKLFWYEHINVN